MDKLIREKQLKELKSRKRWEKIENGYWFVLQSFMLSIVLDGAITFFLIGLGLKIQTTWHFLLACWMLVILLQSLYIITKQHTKNVKDIEDRYENLRDKIK